MLQYNYPTVLLYGEGSLVESAKRIKGFGFKKTLLVTDKTLVKIGIVRQVTNQLEKFGIETILFAETHPNPVENDCIAGAKIFKSEECDALIAVGGGSPMDVAKGIMILATHDGPLSKYDDAKGGDEYILNKLPPLVAIPTTAGTGSEVGRAGVIIVNETQDKTIIFHPTLLPVLAVLEPTLTTELPAPITAATGIDAFIHSLEAYFSPMFHPMADGIGLEGMKLVIENLSKVYEDGTDLDARAKMLLAASMGATAFQKGLGMIHAIAHPLSSVNGLHHGLANALVTPACISFLENSPLNEVQKKKLDVVNLFFEATVFKRDKLSHTLKSYFESLGIHFGLKNHGVKKKDIQILSEKAFQDVSHQTNMIPMTVENFKLVIEKAF